MYFSHAFLIVLIKKYMLLTCLDDTCHSYIYGLYKISYKSVYKKFLSNRICVKIHLAVQTHSNRSPFI
jgi:hypothetical protein